LNEKSSGSRSRKQRLTAVGTRCADHVTPLYPQELALTSPTGGGRSVGIVRVRTNATEFSFSFRCTNVSKFIFGIKLYMFRTIPLSTIRDFCLYTQQCYMSYRFADSLRAGSGRFRLDPARKLSANLYDIYHCCMYRENPMMMDRGTVRNM